MTGQASGPVTCPRCGTANPAEDQFCGNCGADLSVVPATPAPAAGATADGAAPSAEPLVRCATCGTANPAGRSFCQRCGAKLAGAAPVTRLPLDQVAQPPGPVSRPAPEAAAERPGAPAGSAAPRPTTARRADPVDQSGGFGSWLVLAVAGIAVGAVIVVVAIMAGSGGTPPPAAASAAPSASLAPSEPPAPSASAAPASTSGGAIPVTFADGAAVTPPYPQRGVGVLGTTRGVPSKPGSKVWP